MKNIFLLLALTVTSGVFAQNFETSKLNGNQSGSNQSFIYALPQTCISITFEVTKTTIKKGIYAEYAEKYLKLTDVPLKDGHSFVISGIKLQPQAEADPAQYYSITCKTFPDNLQHLFSVSKNGVILDFANTWKDIVRIDLADGMANEKVTDPNLFEKTIREKVDTTYNMVMKDSIMQKIPVFKKQIQAKTQEEIIEETADQLIKTRRHKIKILRGEYEFHPEGAALKVMVEELNKYEEALLALFIGTKTTEKQYYTYTFIPQINTLSKDLCFFNPQKGILGEKNSGYSAITIQLSKNQEAVKGIVPDKGKNALYMRAALMTDVILKLDDKTLLSDRVPVYQFGTIMVMPLN